MRNNSVVLIGCKHCGKTTHGKMLAEKLKVPFFDTDTEIEKLAGMSYRQYIKQNGIVDFMQLEQKVCEKIVSENAGNRIVVATGGNIYDNPPALSALRELDTFLFLQLDLRFAVSRIASKIQQNEDGKFVNAPAFVMEKKPKKMSDVRDIIAEKYQLRYDQYKGIADKTVEIKNAPVEDNFKVLFGALNSNK